MLIEYTLFDIIDKVQTAIDRIKQFCPPEGYWLAFSGGKDSIAIKRLADMAIQEQEHESYRCLAKVKNSRNEASRLFWMKELAKIVMVKYDAHFSLTTVDPPEVLRYVKDYHPDVSMERSDISMWKLIVKKGMPPTRRVRYCCEVLKERGGRGRVLLTGIRWEESYMRRKRRMVETCFKHSDKRYVHPIIDWTEGEVWEFIKQQELPYCSLYDEGFRRIGCVLCPMYRGRKADIKRFPGFYKAYLRAFDKMLEARKEKGLDTIKWDDAQAVMDWWLSDSKDSRVDDDQILFSMFE